MRHYTTKRIKGMLERNLEKKEIYAEDIMCICGISITSALARVQGKRDFKGQEIKKLREHYKMTKDEIYDLLIEQI